ERNRFLLLRPDRLARADLLLHPRLSFLVDSTKIRHDRKPIREPLRAEQDVLTSELVGPVFRSIINEKVADIEIFVVSEDKPLVSNVPDMLLHPKQFVRPRGRILPRRSRQNICIKS